MSFCEGVSVCPRCGGMRASPLMGAAGAAAVKQSMGGLTDNVRGTPRTLDSNMRTVLEERRRREEEIATSQNPFQEKRVNLKTQTDQRHVIKQCDQSEQTGGEQGDEQRDDEDEERDQEEEEDDREEETEEEESDSEEETEEEESDSEEETEEEESDSEEEESDSEEEESEQPARKKRKKHHRKNRTSNRQIQTVDQCEINQTPPGTIRFGLLNARSMKKNASRIKKLITGKKLHVFLSTETFLKHNTADRVLSKASPEGFRSHYQVRADGRARGGVSNQFSEELRGEQIHFDSLNITTFEFVVTELQHDDWNQPVVIVILYRRPPRKQKRQRFRKFLDEFQSLLDEVEKKYSSIIVAGDFNIHVNKKRRSYTDEFYHVWPLYNLTQHLEEPTHEAGNTLDLVLTRNVEVSGLFVQDDGISDHYTVYFNAKPKDTTDKTEENKNEEQK